MEGEQDDQGAHVDQFSRDEGGGAEGSYHTIDPLLVEQFPGTPPGEVVAYTVGGMFVVAAAPTAVGYVAGEIAWPVLARAGSAVASWLCLDGDCTNEIQNVWRLQPMERGVSVERMLGRSPSLAQNFPVIDRFEKGLVTSIKSLDLSARSYQNLSTLTSKVRGYVNTLANWQGVESWGGVRISANSIAAREVLLAVPPGASQAQQSALLRLQQWAAAQGVTLNVVVVP
jgi:hypothetical protein